MAYPTVSAPYGFKPINRLDGLPYAGAVRSYSVAGTSNSAIFNGDLVQLDTNGQVIVSTVTTSNSAYIIGAFTGCSYTSPATNQKLYSQYLPASTAASDIVAFVVDDPFALFKVAVTAANSAMSTATLAAVGSNVSVVLGTGSTTTGDSSASVLAGSETTDPLLMRVVDVVPATAPSATTFSELIVKINNHQFLNRTGV
jgi:hypothetical protein